MTQIVNNAVIAANNIRILSAAMVEKAKSGHPGGSMGGADFMSILFSEFLIYDPNNMSWPHRDRFFLDPGHMSPMLYSTLALAGHYKLEDLKNFRQWGSITPGHPEVDILRGIENTSGPLGQGHTMAVGAAITERFLAARFGEWMTHKIYTFISDGGIQEEISQGAGRIAGHLGLSNLIMFYDSNGIQLSTKVSAVTSEDTAKKYEAWGWRVITINGNDPDQIRTALKAATQEKNNPTLIIGQTIMGKGCLGNEGENFEGRTSTHGQPLSAAGASFENTIKNLGGNPDNPFHFFKEAIDLFEQRKTELTHILEKLKNTELEWRQNNSLKAQKLDDFFSGKTRQVNIESIQQNDNIATRVASSAILSMLADKVENMIVASADLSDSDKTDGFLKKTKAFSKGDFSGAFLQAGVCELTMACIANGMALHGGVVPACGTFFVFSDYMKPAIRLSALMELPVIYIWTHDAFRVGEDGPTHQPVEQEAQIRLMEKLQNHHEQNSMLVLRPADANETTACWKTALENTSTPTGLILSRQNIASLPDRNIEKIIQNVNRGGYIVRDSSENPKAILLASGSEVSTLIEGALLLEKENIHVRVVSIPSEGLFRNQTMEYQHSVLPKDVPKFGLTAGLPVTLQGLTGENGKVWGLSSFGFSAPANVLDNKMGFKSENVCKQVKKMLGL